MEEGHFALGELGMQRPRIYICLPSFSNREARHVLESIGVVEVHKGSERPSLEELKTLAKQVDILIIGIKERFPRELYEQSTRLRVIGTLSIGVDHIDESFLNDDRFTVVRAISSNVDSVAEYCLLIMLMLIKDVLRSRQGALMGQKRALLDRPRDLAGKTVGLVGAGNISRAVIERLKPFGCTLVVWTRRPSEHQELLSVGVRFVDKEELLRTADIISLHIPLNAETEGIIGQKELGMMKKGALIVNTARGQLVDNQAAIAMVKGGRLGGIAIDDFPEVIGMNLPDDPRVIVTPHMAGISNEAVHRMELEVAKAVVDAWKNQDGLLRDGDT
jgi:glyoxylate reductase